MDETLDVVGGSVERASPAFIAQVCWDIARPVSNPTFRYLWNCQNSRGNFGFGSV